MKNLLILFFILVFTVSEAQVYDTVVSTKRIQDGVTLVISQDLSIIPNDTVRYWVKLPTGLKYWSYFSHVDTIVNDSIYQGYYQAPIYDSTYLFNMPNCEIDTLYGSVLHRNKGIGWFRVESPYFVIQLITEADTGKYEGYLYISR